MTKYFKITPTISMHTIKSKKFAFAYGNFDSNANYVSFTDIPYIQQNTEAATNDICIRKIDKKFPIKIGPE